MGIILLIIYLQTNIFINKVELFIDLFSLDKSIGEFSMVNKNESSESYDVGSTITILTCN